MEFYVNIPSTSPYPAKVLARLDKEIKLQFGEDAYALEIANESAAWIETEDHEHVD